VTEGLIPEAEGPLIAERIAEAVSDPMASEWFKPGLRVINEAEILLPSGATKRPDRIIMDQGKVVVIDFKFGEESPDNIKQVGQYLSLLTEMGYTECKGYLWYIEKKKIITV
jgi:CRISPR/Cas system-associated exonuclease Cas4 (RecB family)